jgi:hypothetical protein
MQKKAVKIPAMAYAAKKWPGKIPAIASLDKA